MIERRVLWEFQCDQSGCDDAWIGGTGSDLDATWHEAKEAGWLTAWDEQLLRERYCCPAHRVATTKEKQDG